MMYQTCLFSNLNLDVVMGRGVIRTDPQGLNPYFRCIKFTMSFFMKNKLFYSIIKYF